MNPTSRRQLRADLRDSRVVIAAMPISFDSPECPFVLQPVPDVAGEFFLDYRYPTPASLNVLISSCGARAIWTADLDLTDRVAVFTAWPASESMARGGNLS